eukprot:m.12469 g.12469  ORF g.12469 m.12469 type:complete len:340 (+) comp7216_c0_seq1:47-1066(+)
MSLLKEKLLFVNESGETDEKASSMEKEKGSGGNRDDGGKNKSLLEGGLKVDLMDGEENISQGLKRMVKEIDEDQQRKKEKEQEQNVQIIEPIPGFCVKTNVESGEKIFINVCHSALLPSPPSISDEELALVIANEDNSKFRIPMSIGTAHVEADNHGKPSRAFDVVLNSSVIERLKTREGMKEFLIELAMCQIEAKNDMALNRQYKVLLRRKSMGKLAPQLCRVKTKVQSISRSDAAVVSESEEESFKGPQPEYTMIKEPPSGPPEFLIFEFKLPKLKSTKTVSLDCGETRMVVHARPSTYYIDLDLKWSIRPHDTFAQFNRKTKVLTVTCTTEEQTQR